MTEDVQPAALAMVLDFAERSRAADWSMRSALTRYGQPEPQRASDVTMVLRRLDGALKQHLATFRREGPALWAAIEHDAAVEEPLQPVVDLVRVARDLDRLGDTLAEWAIDITAPRPDGEVDAVTAELAARLDDLGVPREEGPPRPGPDGRPRRRG